MPVAGRSHFAFIAVQGVVVALVFLAAAYFTDATRRSIVGALAGGALAGTVNVGLDSVAHTAGWWSSTEVTTPFGPLLYYAASGVGFGAFALIALWARRRFG